MSAAVQAWQRWWFAPAPLVDLAVGRMIIVLMIYVLNRGGRFLIVGYASADVWEPVDVVALLGIDKPDLQTMQQLHGWTVTLLAFVGLGLFTRVALLALFPLLFLQEALVMSFGKTSHATIPVLWALLFLALSPCDRRLSLDAVLRRRWRRHRPAIESAFARWPLELFYLVLSGFYFSAGLSKLRASGIQWIDGYTLQYHLLHKGVPLGAELAESLWLCAIGSALVLTWQLTFPLGLVRRFRPFFLAGGVAFHMGTGLLMNVWFWPVPTLYLMFVPWSRWATRLRLLARGAPSPRIDQ